MRLLLIISFALLLSSCGKDFTKASTDEIVAATKTTTTQYDSDDYTSLPLIRTVQKKGLLAGNDYIDYRFRLSTSKSGSSRAQDILVSIKYGARRWRYYETVSLVGGEVARLKVVDRTVTNCGTYGVFGVVCDYTEILSLPINDNFIKGNINGFSMRINSEKGAENIIEVPANYVKAFAQLTGN